MTFSEKFLWLSRDRGQSPRAIALTLNFDPSAPAQWKRRSSQPSPEIAKKIAEHFSITVDELLDDTKELSDVVAQREVGKQLGFIETPGGEMKLGSPTVQEIAWLTAVAKSLTSQKDALDTLIASVEARISLAKKALHPKRKK